MLLTACTFKGWHDLPTPSPAGSENFSAVLSSSAAMAAAKVEEVDPSAIPVPASLTGFSILAVIPYEVPVAAEPAPPPVPSLTLQLAEATGTAAPVHQRAEVERLPEEAAAELLAQVPQLAGRTVPPPPTFPTARRNPPPAGGVEVHAFRPLADSAPELTDSGPETELEVVRFSPTGPVDWVPQINVVFSKHMVPLSSHAALAAHVPPVTLFPEVEGEWQWLGTQSLLFRPADLLPKATRYEVTLPQGTAALDGSALAAGFTGSFETPRLRLLRTWPPDRPLRLQPHLALEFNQAIDPQELIVRLRLRAAAQDVGFEFFPRTMNPCPQICCTFCPGPFRNERSCCSRQYCWHPTRR